MNIMIGYKYCLVWEGASYGRFKYKFVQKSDSPIYEIGVMSKKIIFVNESNRSMGTHICRRLAYKKYTPYKPNNG